MSSDKLYTLKEMAEMLHFAFPDEDPEKCARKIRHWTLMDLLTPAGKKHTGTGTSRKYSEDEIRKAGILMELSYWKVPVSMLAENFCEMVDDYRESADWKKALEHSAHVFLSMTYNKDMVNWQLSAGEPSLSLLSKPEEPTELALYDPELLKDAGVDDEETLSLNPSGVQWPAISSAIVLNITKIFYRLGL